MNEFYLKKYLIGKRISGRLILDLHLTENILNVYAPFMDHEEILLFENFKNELPCNASGLTRFIDLYFSMQVTGYFFPNYPLYFKYKTYYDSLK